MIKLLLRFIVKIFLGNELTKEQMDKILSARFLMTILFSSAYCVVILLCTYAMIRKIIAVETGVALIGAFALIVREIADDYFKREDRKIENGGDAK